MAFRGVPGGGPWGVSINAQHPTRKCEINETTADWRRREKNEGAAQEPLKFRILSVISKFYRPVAFRGGPRGSGGRSEWVAINAPRPTRKCEIIETAADGWRGGESEMPSRASAKFRILYAISQFYRSAGFRGDPGDGWPRDFRHASQISEIDFSINPRTRRVADFFAHRRI